MAAKTSRTSKSRDNHLSREDTQDLDSQDLAMIAHGLVYNSHHLDIDKCLAVPASMILGPPWNLPTRMFRFPIVVAGKEGAAPRKLGLMHPLLVDHPFVQKVESILGITINPDGAPNRNGYSPARTATWWHAVDLIQGHWRSLLDTRQFTTDEAIARAVAFGLGSNGRATDEAGTTPFTIRDARKVMDAISHPEPKDPVDLDEVFSQPCANLTEKKVASWPVNTTRHDDPFRTAWATIRGIEREWFSYGRSGYLQWSEQGRKAFQRQPGDPVSSREISDPQAESRGHQNHKRTSHDGQRGFDF